MLHTIVYDHFSIWFLTIQYSISMTVLHKVCEMYLGNVDCLKKILLHNRRVVKCGLLKKCSVTVRFSYTLVIRIYNRGWK